MRGRGAQLTVVCALAALTAFVTAPALALEPARLQLDPTPIARRFSRQAASLDPIGLMSLASLAPVTTRARGDEPASDESPSALEPLAVMPATLSLAPGNAWLESSALLPALTFSGEEGGLAATVARVQQRLFLGVGAYSVDDSGELYDGLESLDTSGRGRTLALGLGERRLLGDFTLSVGTASARADVLQWWEGQADLLDLNPFRDVSAQFDLAIVNGEQSDSSVVVLRVRGAIYGAFGDAEAAANGNGAAPESGDSELGLSLGLKF